MSDLSLSFQPSTADVMAAGADEIERLLAENRAFRTAAHQLTLANELLRDGLATTYYKLAFWGGLVPQDVQERLAKPRRGETPTYLWEDMEEAQKLLAATAACRLCGAETQDGCRGLEQ